MEPPPRPQVHKEEAAKTVAPSLRGSFLHLRPFFYFFFMEPRASSCLSLVIARAPACLPDCLPACLPAWKLKKTKPQKTCIHVYPSGSRWEIKLFCSSFACLRTAGALDEETQKTRTEQTQTCLERWGGFNLSALSPMHKYLSINMHEFHTTFRVRLGLPSRCVLCSSGEVCGGGAAPLRICFPAAESWFCAFFSPFRRPRVNSLQWETCMWVGRRLCVVFLAFSRSN